MPVGVGSPGRCKNKILAKKKKIDRLRGSGVSLTILLVYSQPTTKKKRLDPPFSFHFVLFTFLRLFDIMGRFLKKLAKLKDKVEDRLADFREEEPEARAAFEEAKRE